MPMYTNQCPQQAKKGVPLTLNFESASSQSTKLTTSKTSSLLCLNDAHCRHQIKYITINSIPPIFPSRMTSTSTDSFQSQKTTTDPSNAMQWPFKTLALAVTIPTLLAILAICSVLWYVCYYRPRQRREHQHDERQEQHGQEPQQYIFPEQRTLPLTPDDPIVTTAVAQSLVDSRTEFHPVPETGSDMEAAEQRASFERPRAEGRNGC